MLDKSIDGALLALRVRIVRADGAGLEHVEALLALRGVPLPCELPAKRLDAAKRGAMRRLVLGALRGGPMTMRELAGDVAAGRAEIPAEAAYRRARQALQKLKATGLVADDGRRWSLTPRAASSPSKPG